MIYLDNHNLELFIEDTYMLFYSTIIKHIFQIGIVNSGLSRKKAEYK